MIGLRIGLHGSIKQEKGVDRKHMKLLLHACCGPCSLEPVRILQRSGHDITIAYMNANIHPAAEYDRRLATLRAWANTAHVDVIEGVYDPLTWEERVGTLAGEPQRTREDRCRACYRLRFEETARYAAAHGFEGISTTLSVSPYQYTDAIRDELEAIGRASHIDIVFEDFRSFYDEATRLSRSLGMYRQNYCGCRLSQAEAEVERRERKHARELEKQAKQKVRAQRVAEEEAMRAAKRKERQAYAEKQAAKQRALKAFREAKASTTTETTTTKAGSTVHEN